MKPRTVLAGLACLILCAASLTRAALGPGAPIPRKPAALARALVKTKTELARAVDEWRSGGGGVPPEVTLDALYDQRIELLLAARPRLARATLRRVPAGTARVVRTNLAAKRELWRLTPVTRSRRFRTGRALRSTCPRAALRATIAARSARPPPRRSTSMPSCATRA